LKIVGSKRSMVVGKELEIRRWFSRSHLYSSAFLVTVKYNPHGEAERFTLHGAGWGHGVGLCQIGAAVMATRGFSAEQILRHYFRGIEIKKIYF
jgi:SpoIID/LytB domain protein